MTLAHVPYGPSRIEQGFPLTGSQHDSLHNDPITAINAIIDYLNTLPVVVGGSIQTGMIIEWTTNTAPAGYLMCNGAAVSRTTYAALFAVIGTTYGVGDGSTTFGVPDRRGRVGIGTNPMGGSTNGALSTRTLGQSYGAETTNYTPAGNVSQASIASITATLDPIDISGLVVTVSQASVASITATLGSISLAAVTAISSAIDTSGLTVDINAGLTNGALIPTGASITVNNVSCVDVDSAEADTSVIACAVLSVSSTDIAAQISSNVTGDTTAAVAGTIPTPTITVGGSIASPAITIGGSIPVQTATLNGTIPTPDIELSGSIPAQTFTGTAANISTIQPGLAVSYIIKT